MGYGSIVTTMSDASKFPSEYSAATIEVLTGLEAVRRRPRMYVGDLDAPELPSNLLLEAVCHALDEILDGKCTAVTIDMTGTRSAWVKYDAGMSLDAAWPGGDTPAAEAFLTLHKACHNLKKHIAVGDRYCQFGLAVLNAFSEDLVATTSCSGQTATLHFARGKMAPYDIEPTDGPNHTIIAFKLDETLISGVFDQALISTAIAALGEAYPQACFQLEAQAR